MGELLIIIVVTAYSAVNKNPVFTKNIG